MDFQLLGADSVLFTGRPPFIWPSAWSRCWGTSCRARSS